MKMHYVSLALLVVGFSAVRAADTTAINDFAKTVETNVMTWKEYVPNNVLGVDVAEIKNGKIDQKTAEMIKQVVDSAEGKQVVMGLEALNGLEPKTIINNATKIADAVATDKELNLSKDSKELIAKAQEIVKEHNDLVVMVMKAARKDLMPKAIELAKQLQTKSVDEIKAINLGEQYSAFKKMIIDAIASEDNKDIVDYIAKNKEKLVLQKDMIYQLAGKVNLFNLISDAKKSVTAKDRLFQVAVETVAMGAIDDLLA